MAARFTVGSFLLAGVSCVLLASSYSEAAFGTPSWTRPTTVGQASTDGTTFQQWNFFSDDDLGTVAIEDLAPDVANINPSGSAAVYEPGTGFLTGGGNIYSPTGNLKMALTIPGIDIGPGITKFLLQIKTIGNELVNTNYPNASPVYDFTKFAIDGRFVALTDGFSYSEISRVAGGQGFTVEHAFEFTVPHTGTSHTLSYVTLASSTSQDVIAVDTQVVLPEPASMGLLGLGAVVLVRRRRAK